MLGSVAKEIESTDGVLAVMQLLRRTMACDVVDSLLLWKEMAVVSDGWDIHSWDFRGELVMPSPSRGGLCWLWPRSCLCCWMWGLWWRRLCWLVGWIGLLDYGWGFVPELVGMQHHRFPWDR